MINYWVLASRARPCAARTSLFWAHCHAKRGAARPPPIAASLLHIHRPKKVNLLFPETKVSPGPRSAARVKYLSTGPPRLWNITFPAPRPSCRTLLSYTAPYWASSHPKELCCTLLRYAASSWASMHPTKLHCTVLSYVVRYWDKLHPSELRCTLLSYATPYWATLHPTKLCSTLLSYAAPYLSYAAP
jgi:hypothetical protein